MVSTTVAPCDLLQANDVSWRAKSRQAMHCLASIHPLCSLIKVLECVNALNQILLKQLQHYNVQ